MAQWLGTPAGIRMARGLQHRSNSGTLASATQPPFSDEDGPEAISIWKRAERDGTVVFERPEATPWGDHYASKSVLQAGRPETRKRICLFGESVAAGYLYAPHLTPAKVLSHQLREIDTQQSYEVIDLARTNETIDGLGTTVRQALHLNPDLLVVFAGNNWNLLETSTVSPYVPVLDGRLEYGRALERNGLLGPIENASRRLLEKSWAFLGKLEAMAAAQDVPVVLVLPEVNLADWENRQAVAWLPRSATRDWYGHYRRALAHLARGLWDEATLEAHRMIELDGYTCPSSQRLLAKALLGAGDSSGAKQACRAELDANQYATLCFIGAPQATPLVQGILERAAPYHGFALVDLRRCFEARAPTELPGRRLFLDYCHLTARGMHVAMAGVAAEAVRLLSDSARRPDWTEVARAVPSVKISAAAESTAFLGAAIHNAHRLLTLGEKSPILEYWCGKALRASPGVRDAMVNLIALRLDPGGELHRGQVWNLESEHRLGFQHGLQYPHLDAELIRTIVRVLSAAGDCRDIDEIIGRRALDGSAIDLASPENLWEPLERFYPEVMASQNPPETAYHRSAWPSSSFALPSRGGRGLRLEITARLPTIDPGQAPSAGRVVVLANGVPAAGFFACGRWRKMTVTIPGGLVASGLNKLTFQWPPLQCTGERALQTAIRRLQRGLPADVHPVFGEVAQILASPC